MTCSLLATTLILLSTVLSANAQTLGQAWTRHIVDDASRGADGARLADANGDGLLDIATAWEEGGVVRVYINPGHADAQKPWPAVTVGSQKNGEDAVLVDVDRDGAMDVVSCHEGKSAEVVVHWAPKEKDRYLDPAAWSSEPFPALAGKEMWMFCLPVEQGLVVGSKGHYGKEGGRGPQVPASVGLLQAPADRRDLSAWTWTKWADAGWIMSLEPADLNGDGRADVVVSDRYGPDAGVYWYENPGDSGQWIQHKVIGLSQQCLFLTPAALQGKQQDIVLASTRELLWLRPDGTLQEKIPMPNGFGDGKAVSVGDIDGDGTADIVFTCEHASGKGDADKSGIGWLKKTASGWEPHDIGGPEGIKFDLCPLVDLDGDGDLDVLTTEERQGGEKGGLGVVWYENPAKSPISLGQKR